MSYMELFNFISKPWTSIKEIRLIDNCGRDSAIKIQNKIEEKITKTGNKLPKSKTIVVPMKEVLDYLHLYLKYITEIAINEKKVKMNESDGTIKYACVSE